MSANTPIQWTGRTWNPLAAFDKVTGKRGWFCTRVSPGCKNCYAAKINMRLGNGHDYVVRHLNDIEFRLVNVEAPLSWRKPLRVFVNSMTDLFHESVSDDLIAQVFAVMGLASWHTFQVLTKRAERMRTLLSDPEFAEMVVWHQDDWSDFAYEQAQRARQFNPNDRRTDDWAARDLAALPLQNVWLGVSVEDQQRADERIPALLNTPAAIRFLSCEPLLSELDLNKVGTGPWYNAVHGFELDRGGVAFAQPSPAVDWVIVGGESGGGSRQCGLNWIRDIVDQCRRAETPVFVKQLGKYPVERSAGVVVWPLVELRDPKGGDMSEWPVDLCVREFPKEPVPA
jgi:protein gp37